METCCTADAAQREKDSALSLHQEPSHLGLLLSAAKRAEEDLSDAFDVTAAPLELLPSPLTTSPSQLLTEAASSGDDVPDFMMLVDEELPAFAVDLSPPTNATTAKVETDSFIKDEPLFEEQPWLSMDVDFEGSTMQSATGCRSISKLRAIHIKDCQRSSQETIRPKHNGPGRYKTPKPVHCSYTIPGCMFDGVRLCMFPGCVKLVQLQHKCLTHFDAVPCSASGCAAPVRGRNRCHKHLSSPATATVRLNSDVGDGSSSSSSKSN